MWVYGQIGGERAAASLAILCVKRKPAGASRCPEVAPADRLHRRYRVGCYPASALVNEVRDGAWCLAALADIGETAATDEPSACPVARDHTHSGQAVLPAEYSLRSESASCKAQDNLKLASAETTSYALELLDTTLSTEDKRRVLPLFERRSPEALLNAIPLDGQISTHRSGCPPERDTHRKRLARSMD